MTDTSPASSTVLVYGDDPAFRDAVRTAIGRRPAHDVARIEYVEAATNAEVLAIVDAGGVDLCIFDGEAWPTGGLGISRQLKNELADCPTVMVVVARADDAWLGTWSQADAVVSHPIDPQVMASTAASLLRQRAALTAPAAAPAVTHG